MSRRSGGGRALTQKEFRVLAATTLGYYLVRDLVKRTWPRRIGQTAVLAAGTGVILADEWEALSDAEREEVTAALTQMSDAVEVPPVPGPVVLAAGGTAALGGAAWLTGRVDAAGASLVTNTLGRVPLVGGVFRTLPSTVFGAAQVGVVYVVNERARA
ncbi:hypothetical protein [Corynebacterium sp.]|jgi:hypothetical protein|uniref:hypothetical protein n=1 Tax=Corynebacterium sp. TaxID=1720 RepID=UPI0025C57F22|nr:hypothetical protein [Corynebacterium sp.]